MTAPWMEPLDAKTRAAVERLVADAPKITGETRERLRLLFRGGGLEQ
jgi:hypothetical protein